MKLDRVKMNRENVCTKRMKAKVIGDGLERKGDRDGFFICIDGGGTFACVNGLVRQYLEDVEQLRRGF